MRIEDIINTHEEMVLTESKGIIRNTLNALKRVDWKKAQKIFKDNFIKFSNIVKAAGIEDEVVSIINKNLGTKFKNLDSMIGMRVVEKRMDEGLGDWWKEASGNLYGALSFYPILTMFLELDKVIKGLDTADIKSVVIYGLMWVGVISGKVAKEAITGRKSKKKENHVKASVHPSQAR